MFKKKSKKIKRKYNTRKFIYNNKGGQLIMLDTDLKNTHICRTTETDTYKESPGFEVYSAIDSAIELNDMTISFFLYSFTKVENKWFKFVIFNNNDTLYIYIINGAPINKHSVCMLQGLLNVTQKTDEYHELRDAYNKVIELKSIGGIDVSNLENIPDIINLNTIIARDIPCMPVISAGSGTVNEDGSICINTKSGHYKPTEDSMVIAKDLFAKITKRNIVVIKKEDKEKLKEKYGKQHKLYSGICL